MKRSNYRVTNIIEHLNTRSTRPVGPSAVSIDHSTMSIEDALLSRKTVRAFDRTRRVPLELVKRILDVARHAPSDNNIQQWKVYVVAGSVRDALVKETLQLRHQGILPDRAPTPALDSDPKRRPRVYPDLYTQRSKSNGRQYYRHIGILGDRKRGREQQIKNYEFFGAPVGLFFFTDLNYLNAWRDCGMFIQSVMLAARAYGLHTIAQGAWTNYDELVRKFTHAPLEETMLCGMGLGYEDPADIVNTLRTDRVPLQSFAKFSGFE